MVLVNKKHLNLLIIFHLISIISISLYFFYMINNVDLSDPVAKKYHSEVIIFLMIIIVSINVPLIMFILRKNTRIINEFNKLIEYSKLHNFSSQHQSVKQLDVIGVKITELFQKINDLGNKRIIKLSSMYAIVEHLSDFHNGCLIIINIEGDILFVSNVLEKKLKTDKILLQTLNIKDLIDINLKSLLVQLDNEKKDLDFKDVKIVDNVSNLNLKSITVYPIFNSEHLLSNAIIYLNI